MNSKVTGEGGAASMLRSKKIIAIFANKQRLLRIEMKTKLVLHVQSEWMRDWKSARKSERMWEWLSNIDISRMSEWESASLKVFQVPSFCLMFRHFLLSSINWCWSWSYRPTHFSAFTQNCNVIFCKISKSYFYVSNLPACGTCMDKMPLLGREPGKMAA